MKKIVAITIMVLVIVGTGVLLFNKAQTEATVNPKGPTATRLSPNTPETQRALAPVESESSAENAGAPESKSPVVEETPVQAPSAPPATPEAVTSVQSGSLLEGVGQAAIEKAAEENKYLFLLFSENDAAETLSARQALEAAADQWEDKVQLAYVDKNQPAEKDVIEKFGLNGAPMPIVLAMAPNGAITGAYFGDKLKELKLEESIAGPGEQQCMKALQDGKLVLVSLQNTTTTSNETAMQGVKDFKADTRFAEATEVVTLDPANDSDQRFIGKLRIDPKIQEATTAFLAPPGSLIKTITGATTKDELVAALMAATSGGCGTSCKPGACGPRK